MKQMFIGLCKGCFDSYHLEFGINVDLELGYVFPDQDRDTFRGSVFIFVYVIILSMYL